MLSHKVPWIHKYECSKNLVPILSPICIIIHNGIGSAMTGSHPLKERKVADATIASCGKRLKEESRSCSNFDDHIRFDILSKYCTHLTTFTTPKYWIEYKGLGRESTSRRQKQY